MSQRRRPDDLPADDPRRRFLVQALSLGWLAGGGGWQLPAQASVFGSLPKKLPEGKSIFELKGDVQVNGRPATLDTVIRPSDKVTTAPGSHVIAVVGQDAFILREKSALEFDAAAALKQSMRLVTGALLSVFGRRADRATLNVRTSTVTIGIRGTGVYLEADAEKTYVCTCYGTTDMAATADPKAKESVTTTHHNAPRYVLANPDNGRRIIPGPFINHTDLELMTIEALVGRQVPFGLPDTEYQAPRREY
jgi:hypothetical protein